MVPADGPFPDRLRADDLPVEVVATPPSLSRYGRATTGPARARAILELPAYWWRLWRELRRLQPDLVHVVDHRGLVLALVPARLAGVPVVWQIHGLDPTRVLNRWGGRLARSVVVPTDTVVPKLPGLAPRRAIRVATNVVGDQARHAPLPPTPTGCEVVTVARLHPDKGLDLLIDALVEVRRRVPTARVRIVGAPQEGFEQLSGELLERAATVGVGDAVDLVGFVDDPSAIVRTARCYVQPARERTEILPLSILEAMAAGAPVVATDVGGVRDVVDHERTGLLVAPEDVGALAAAIGRVLEDDGLADRLRTAAHALVGEPRFSEDHLVRTMAGIYEEATRG